MRAVHALAEKVARYIRRQRLLKAGDRVGLAVSGGADSVALLRLLLELRKELGLVLSVAHFHHGLRGAEADADEKFVAELTRDHKLVYRNESADIKSYAQENHLSVEAAARKLRYQYFDRLLTEDVVDHVATGHTLDDQAETVLMRLARGAGTRGLAGIYPQLSVASSQFSVGRGSPLAGSRATHPSSIIRPLLPVRRRELEEYLRSIGQAWREDSSNRDLRFARNRVRHGILPRLERGLNPAVRECLAEAAEIARAEEDYWCEMVERALPSAVVSGGRQDTGVTLRIPELVELPLALRRRVVRATLNNLGVNLEFQRGEEILEIVSGAAKGAALPHGWSAVRVGDRLEISARRPEAVDYEYKLAVPGRVVVPEVGITLEAILLPQPAGYNPQHCLELSLLTTELRVRNWRAGDRYWPPHTKAPKKVKELLQEHHVTGSEKKLWPVVESGNEIVWVRGFAVPSRFGARNGEAVLIREERLDSRSGARTTTK